MRTRLPIALLLAGVLCVASRAQDAPVRTSYTQLRKFTLPFNFDSSRGKVKELKLWFALNNNPWEQGLPSNAEKKGFDVDVKQDGTYDFAVQAEYEDGKLEPASLDQLKTHIRVVVDSTAPLPKVDSIKGNPGTGGVEWLIDDPNVDPSFDAKAVQLEGRWPGEANWMPIQPRNGDPPFGRKGEYFFQLGAKRFEVRVKATDRAKNVGYSRVVVTPPDGNNDYQPQPADPNTTKNLRAKQYFINSTRITLETKVVVGKSGIASVDLYQTDSENRNAWKKVEKVELGPADPANAVSQGEANGSKQELRKLTFEVPKEGLYGFIVGGKNGVGLGPGLPPDGTPPRVLIVVDSTPPVVTINEARVIPSGIRGNMLSVTWQVTDPNLAGTPIVIDISENPTDPNAKWRTIAENLDNTPSRYTWVIDDTVPPKFFVRVKAIDRATNIGQAVSAKAVIADHTIPEFEIQGVEPGK